MQTAEQLADELAAVIEKNGGTMPAMQGLLLIEKAVLRRGLRDWMRSKVPFVKTGLDRTIPEKVAMDLAANESVLIENEFGRIDAKRFRLASEIYANMLSDTTAPVTIDSMANAAVAQADALLIALERSPLPPEICPRPFNEEVPT